MNRIIRRIILILPTAALSIFIGCNVGPMYHAPQLDLPTSFTDASVIAPTTGPSTQPTTQSTRPINPNRWWEALEDPELNSLIKRVLVSNLDLQIANARLQEARATEFATTGGAFPGVGQLAGVDVAAAAGRGSGSDSTRSRVPSQLTSATNTKNFKEITQVIGLDAGWEIDLFGHYSHLIDASQADVQAIAEARNDILITLLADVVRTYADVRSFQYRLEVAKQNLASQQKTLDLVRVRVKRELSNELDAALAERQLSTTLSRIAPLESSLESAKRRVAILVGLYPEDLKTELDQPRLLPTTPPMVVRGMPVDLLKHRPDIRRAERELAASTARLGLATADLFPRISLTASAGIQGQGIGQQPEKDRYIYSVGPGLYWPFFDFGRLDAVIQAQDARTQQLLLTHKRAVILAIREVNDAVSNYAADQDSLAQLGNAVSSSARAVALAQQRYEIGLTDFLNVLDAERQLFDLQDQYAVGQATVVRDFVALNKALGGGWGAYQTPAMPPPPKPAALAAFDVLFPPQKK